MSLMSLQRGSGSVWSECTFIYLSPSRWQLNATLLPSGKSALPLAASRAPRVGGAAVGGATVGGAAVGAVGGAL